MWQHIGIVLYYFRLVVDKLFNPMDSFPLNINWSVTTQILCNRWTESLLISLSKSYTFLYISYTICLSHIELVPGALTQRVILNILFDLTRITYSSSYLFYYLWLNEIWLLDNNDDLIVLIRLWIWLSEWSLCLFSFWSTVTIEISKLRRDCWIADP